MSDQNNSNAGAESGALSAGTNVTQTHSASPEPVVEDWETVEQEQVAPKINFTSYIADIPMGKKIMADGSKVQYKFGFEQFAERQEMSLAELATKFKASHFLTAGCYDANRVVVVPQGVERPTDAKHPRRSRTKEECTYPAAPGLMVIDNDFAKATGDTLKAIAATAPAMLKAGHISKGSSGSYITAADGTELRGCKGEHLLTGVIDATDIPRASEALHVRCLLGGSDHTYVGAAGQILERSPVDTTVSSPWQPVFLAAHLDEGLSQDLHVVLHDGPLLDTKAAIPDLTADEQAAYMALKAKHRFDLKGEVVTKKAACVEARVSEGWTREAATQAIESAKLTLAAQITLSDGTVVSVRDVLADPGKYHGQTTLDPLEPEYRGGAVVGKLYLDHERPNLYSQAHGGKTYWLGIAAEDEFADDFDEVVPAPDAPRMDDDVRWEMNHCISTKATLDEAGYQQQRDGTMWLERGDRTATEIEPGVWSLPPHTRLDGAAMLAVLGYKGDELAAEAAWKEHSRKPGHYDLWSATDMNPVCAQSVERAFAGSGKHIGFSFSSTRDLLDSNVNPEWIVKGLVERSTVMAVAGPPKEGKSFVTYDMGMHIAAGIDWGNHKVTQGAVFVIAGEGHGGIARRVKAWHKQHPGHEGAPFFVSKRGALLDTGNEAEAVANVIAGMIAEHGVVPAVVILDTLARNMAGEENSNTDMSRLVKAVDVSFKDRFGFAVLIVHHSTKDGGELLRGASSLKGALDGLIEVRKLKQVPMTVEVITHFLKDGETPGKLTFECERVVIGIDEDMDEITSLVPKLVANTYAGKDGELVPADLSRAMDALRTIDNGQAIPLKAAREALAKAGVIKSANPSNQRGDAKDLFDKLVEKGLIRREGSTSTSSIVLLPVGWASFDEPPL